MVYKINKFNDISKSWIYRISDLLITNPELVIDGGLFIGELELAKYSAEEVPELIHYLIHFDRNGAMKEGQIENFRMQLKDRSDSAEIIQELKRLGKLRTERKEKQLAESKAEHDAERNDTEYQAAMWRNDLELQLWDENSDLDSEQRSVYERQLSGLR